MTLPPRPRVVRREPSFCPLGLRGRVRAQLAMFKSGDDVFPGLEFKRADGKNNVVLLAGNLPQLVLTRPDLEMALAAGRDGQPSLMWMRKDAQGGGPLLYLTMTEKNEHPVLRMFDRDGLSVFAAPLEMK